MLSCPSRSEFRESSYPRIGKRGRNRPILKCEGEPREDAAPGATPLHLPERERERIRGAYWQALDQATTERDAKQRAQVDNRYWLREPIERVARKFADEAPLPRRDGPAVSRPSQHLRRPQVHS